MHLSGIGDGRSKGIYQRPSGRIDLPDQKDLQENLPTFMLNVVVVCYPVRIVIKKIDFGCLTALLSFGIVTVVP